MAKVTMEITFNNCSECPFLKRGSGFDGYDGRTYTRVFYCGEGVFGKPNAIYNNYDEGPSEPPEKFPENCRFNDENEV